MNDYAKLRLFELSFEMIRGVSKLLKKLLSILFCRDHTLKVFLTDSNTLHFTLHGHTSPISAILIDRFQPSTGYSGSQDGLLFVWDFVTGIATSYLLRSKLTEAFINHFRSVSLQPPSS